ncbi:MAG: hypothetical protein ACM3PR_01670, partial [Bacteroidales bacterium]
HRTHRIDLKLCVLCVYVFTSHLVMVAFNRYQAYQNRIDRNGLCIYNCSIIAKGNPTISNIQDPAA